MSVIDTGIELGEYDFKCTLLFQTMFSCSYWKINVSHNVNCVGWLGLTLLVQDLEWERFNSCQRYYELLNKDVYTGNQWDHFDNLFALQMSLQCTQNFHCHELW